MILIITKKFDDFVNKVISFLGNTKFVVIGPNNSVKMKCFSLNEKNIEVHFESQIINSFELSEIKSIWYNGGRFESWDDNISEDLNLFENNNHNIVLQAALNNLKIKSIGNANGNFKSENKIDVLIKAKKLGLNIPDTIITTSKKELIRFFNKHKTQGIICKRIGNETNIRENDITYSIVRTIRMQEDEIEDLPECFGFSLFQENLDKSFEVRSIFFNKKVYSAAIIEVNNLKTVDYRNNIGSDSIRIVPYEISKKVELKTFRLLEKLNIGAASVDYILQPNGKYTFLEVNPIGQISFLNKICNFNLDNKFANFLKHYE